ncbi:MAG: glycosyltransferase family 2 protein [Verrucomicrobiales bacterium]|nr:glycosyltransferase family 2 protein [Verrucomicrobiales bacterium]
MISVLILTKNEEQDLPGCLASVSWCDDVHILDSLSTDRTVAIAKESGVHVTQRPFDDWAAHQNWAVSNLPFRHPWVLYIDADERVSDSLHDAIRHTVRPESPACAFRIRRRDFYADGTWLKRAQISPFFIRLFRPCKIRYERLVNPVAIVDGPIHELEGILDHYPFSKGVGFWMERHVRYADAEARMIVERNDRAFSWKELLSERDRNERRKHQKRLFYLLPCRPLVKFVYMLFWRRAFLDGRAGITYAALQSIYEYLIVLKTRELQRAGCHVRVRTAERGYKAK